MEMMVDFHITVFSVKLKHTSPRTYSVIVTSLVQMLPTIVQKVA